MDTLDYMDLSVDELFEWRWCSESSQSGMNSVM